MVSVTKKKYIAALYVAKNVFYFSEFAFVGGVFVSEIVVERIVIVVRILAGSKNVFFW